MMIIYDLGASTILRNGCALYIPIDAHCLEIRGPLISFRTFLSPHHHGPGPLSPDTTPGSLNVLCHCDRPRTGNQQPLTCDEILALSCDNESIPLEITRASEACANYMLSVFHILRVYLWHVSFQKLQTCECTSFKRHSA